MTTWLEPTELEQAPPTRPGGTGVVTALTALIVFLLAVSGVGLATVGEEDNAGVVSAVTAAYDQATSARIEISQTLSIGGAKIEMRGEQLADIANGRSSSSIGLPGGLGTLHMIQEGPVFYVRMERTKTAPAGAGWWKVTIRAKDSPVGLMAQVAGADMRDTLANLRKHGIAPDKIGTDQIDGHDATHYRARLSGTDLAEQMTDAEIDALEDSGVDIANLETRNDMWISADGLPRRVEIVTDLPGGSSITRLDITNYNVPVEVAIPGPESVVREETVENMIEFQEVFMELGSAAGEHGE